MARARASTSSAGPAQRALSSVTGLPSLTMPMGIGAEAGAPVGFVLLARPGAEARLLQAAADFERRYRPRRPPLFGAR